jgi:hypothetical protein
MEGEARRPRQEGCTKAAKESSRDYSEGQMTNLEELRKAAEKATPGPWRYSPWHIEEGPSCVRKDGYGIVATVASDDMAIYLAKVDPQTILEIIGEIERLRTVLRNIAEGNLGDSSWQANYVRIRSVARAALMVAALGISHIGELASQERPAPAGRRALTEDTSNG